MLLSMIHTSIGSPGPSHSSRPDRERLSSQDFGGARNMNQMSWDFVCYGGKWVENSAYTFRFDRRFLNNNLTSMLMHSKKIQGHKNRRA